MSAPDIGHCPGEIELARALTIGADGALRMHVDACARCGAEWRAHQALIELARQAEPSAPTRDRHEQLRIQLLATAERVERRPGRGHGLRLGPWMGIAAAGLAVAAAIAFVVLRRTSPDPTPKGTVGASHLRRGTVIPHLGAVFQLDGAQPDEIVRLTDGRLSLGVEPLAAGGRFRVITGDGEVEVRGTSFDVTARDDRLVAVIVAHGRVEVRPLHGAHVVLVAGERWDAPEVVHTPAQAPPVDVTASTAQPAGPRDRSMRIAPRAAPLPVPLVAPPARSQGEQAFADGWDALRGGDAAAAASLFEQSLAAEPGGVLAEDASFWHGVALARAGRRAGGERALARFLVSYPSSARAGEASTMLGWLLLDDGDLDGAERRFAAAKSDVSASVRADAAEGLAEIARRRQR